MNMKMDRIFYVMMLLFSSMAFCCCSEDSSESGDGLQETPLPKMIDPDDVCTSMMDPVFMKYCYQNFDINDDKKVSVFEASMAKQIVGDNLVFSDLTGIQYFSALEVLDISKGNFTAIDLSRCSNLKKLKLKSALRQLDLSNNKKLEKVELNGVKTSTLDISFLDSLSSLICKSCTNLREVKIKYSQLDFCNIDNIKVIHFVIADEPNRELKKSAVVTYSFTEYDKQDMAYSSLRIIAGDNQYDMWGVSNTTNQKVITFDTLPARSEYILSASYSGRTPHLDDLAFYVTVSIGFKLTIKVDIYLENKLLLSSNMYNCIDGQGSSYSVNYSPYDAVKKDLNALIGGYLNSVQALSKYKVIEIDEEGNVHAQ